MSKTGLDAAVTSVRRSPPFTPARNRDEVTTSQPFGQECKHPFEVKCCRMYVSKQAAPTAVSVMVGLFRSLDPVL
jgi:hypothetical protein